MCRCHTSTCWWSISSLIEISFLRDYRNYKRIIPNINVIEEEITQIPKGDIPVVVATGPLTSDALSQDIRTYTKQEGLYFYDAAAPIIEKDSIDMNKV